MADVLPSIIDHFIQLISGCFWIHLKCQTLMLSISTEDEKTHCFGCLMYKKPSDEKMIFPFLSVFCFLCYSSGNRFKNLKSLRWHAELRHKSRHCHPLIWCCVMKRPLVWFLTLITKLQCFLPIQLWSLRCHKLYKWSRAVLAHNGPTGTHICYHSLHSTQRRLLEG